MPYSLPPKRFETSILDIRRPTSSVAAEERAYVVSLLVNDSPCTYELAESDKIPGALGGAMSVFGAYRRPTSTICDYVRRFAIGEILTFPIHLGDIGAER